MGLTENAAGATVTALGRLQAVLFDLDGVITDTAEAHAAAWKRLFDEFLRGRARTGQEELGEFDSDRDYRQYVDGMPRHDGIVGFLRSRGIDLPQGTPEDPPEADTVCGLGQRKQQYFRAWLDSHQVGTYPGTLKLIRELHELGVKIAVFSSSRNTADVLRNAGVFDLFPAKVDGNDLAALGLPGKPHPAMLYEAASRLGVAPERAAVIEDAISGVQAAAAGGFALVIGVDRREAGDAGQSLKDAGAHVVVADLSELSVTSARGLSVKTLDNLPRAVEHEPELRARLAQRRAVVFLDYDGTLTPIVEDPDQALLAADMRRAVAELARCCKVAIVSGRDLEALKGLLQLDTVFFAGSHGFEIQGPGGATLQLERGVESLAELDSAEQRLTERLAHIPGHQVERQRFAIAVHYRRAPAESVPSIEAVVDETLSEHRGLRKGHGKKVFRVQPSIDWHKGRAVLWLLERLELDAGHVLPIYVGDDLTDEDAFRALSGRGLSVVVRDPEPRATAADYSVADVSEVKRLLEILTSIEAAAGSSSGGTG